MKCFLSRFPGFRRGRERKYFTLRGGAALHGKEEEKKMTWGGWFIPSNLPEEPKGMPFEECL